MMSRFSFMCFSTGKITTGQDLSFFHPLSLAGFERGKKGELND